MRGGCSGVSANYFWSKRTNTMGKTATKTTSASKAATPALGGTEVLLRQLASGMAPTNVAVRKRRFRSLVRKGPLSVRDWSHVLHMELRTLNARISKDMDLPPLEADRVRLVERVMERGDDVFGDLSNFEHWLDRPHPLIGGKKPKELLNSTDGIGWVMMELGRIEHGIF